MTPINSRNTSTRRSLPFPSNNQSTTIIKPSSTSNSSLSKSITSSLSKSTSTPIPTTSSSSSSQSKLNQSRRQSVIPQLNRPISITTTALNTNRNNNQSSTNNNRTPTLPRSRNVSLNLPQSNLNNLSNTSNQNNNNNNVAPLKRSPLNRNTIANFTPLSSERSRTFTTPATTPSPQVINRNLLPESSTKPEDIETEVPDDEEEIDEEVESLLFPAYIFPKPKK
ncbi:uncharacterized protein MELLADRAFT_76309 [Melampsora larici-populina 98AG31]|uniref:Uncharacterized protein n=1 Tax=Melampsora larici-populina (strain 98AG31 / pathotype 3-4-7) TaxID=747676 RepID=F4R3W7_MELLP|nr:uncharacterized protein MELLADRAFT_76309 [Melampsora larici-populina 98AG31]EGG12692.1 hypothetical protein MELLADRAFT_76309 [Melampsora larici-populina 98AG31]